MNRVFALKESLDYHGCTAEISLASRWETWVDVIRDRAQHGPEQVVYTFLVDGEARESRLAYHDLEHKARGIAAALQQRHRSDDRALLLYPPGLDYIAAFFGCLYGSTAPPESRDARCGIPR
jgi:acyl-CoA synthetase (AMP-forming)/AMP-acid ligase II